VLEDVAMAKVFLNRGLTVSGYGGRGTISFRMYPRGPKDLVEGWSKNFGAGAFSIRLWCFAMIVLWISGCFRASSALVRALVILPTMGAWLPCMLYGLYVLQVGWMLKRIGRFQWWAAVLFPAPLAFFVLIMLRSLVLTYVLRRVVWKGRTITPGATRR
jgi:4,4'-diaponeurosporenoate glycosyltransferase